MKFFLNKFRDFINLTKIYIRYYYWRLLFKRIGKNVRFYGKIIVFGPINITIGDNCSLNSCVFLDATFSSISIGNNVRISPHSMILTSGINYKENPPKSHFGREIIIEDDVWIGSGAIILPGVKICKNSVIGAAAVIVNNVPPNSLVVGAPGKIKKYI